MNRPVSGRPSETYFRIHQQLHVDNVPRYFKGLDYWVRNVSTLTLAYITQNLQAELGPTLRPLPRQNQ